MLLVHKKHYLRRMVESTGQQTSQCISGFTVQCPQARKLANIEYLNRIAIYVNLINNKKVGFIVSTLMAVAYNRALMLGGMLISISVNGFDMVLGFLSLR